MFRLLWTRDFLARSQNNRLLAVILISNWTSNTMPANSYVLTLQMVQVMLKKAHGSVNMQNDHADNNLGDLEKDRNSRVFRKQIYDYAASVHRIQDEASYGGNKGLLLVFLGLVSRRSQIVKLLLVLFFL